MTPLIDEYLQDCGALCIEGPKWCGKTWTSAFHSRSAFYLGNPEYGFSNRALALEKPSLVLKGDRPRMIDEWQEANCLWDATRAEVDSSTDNGLLILTGSSTPKTKGVLHSGSGRIVDLRMNTMSLYESADSTGDVSLKGLCEGSAEQKLTGEVDIRFLANLIVRGGWPRNLETKNPSILPFSYVAKLIDSNLSDEVSDFKYTHHKTELILKSLARNESTTASISSIAKGISEYEDELVSHDTVAKYLEALDRMFLFNNQRPFGPNRRSSLRVKMMEKRHFCDPALA